MKAKIFYRKLSDAIKLFIWAFKNTETLNVNNFKMLSDLLALIFKVANDGKNYMTHIAYCHPQEGEKEIVSIWAGAGIGAEPTKRIAELIEENEQLKAQINTMLISMPDTGQ